MGLYSREYSKGRVGVGVSDHMILLLRVYVGGGGGGVFRIERQWIEGTVVAALRSTQRIAPEEFAGRVVRKQLANLFFSCLKANISIYLYLYRLPPSVL